MEDARTQLFSRSAADIRVEIERLREEVARHHREELSWANSATSSPLPTIGAMTLIRTMWDIHRLKLLIRGLERDLRRIELQYSRAAHRLLG